MPAARGGEFAGPCTDSITLKAEFEHAGILEEVGGIAYLLQLVTAMVSIINAGEYGHAVLDTWIRRRLIEIGETMVNNAFGANSGLDGARQIEAGEQALFDLAAGHCTEGGSVTFRRALNDAIMAAERAYRRPGSVSSLTFGLRDVDNQMGGMQASDLLILAGRPGMGKTALATKIAFGAAQALQAEARQLCNGHLERIVAIFSIEMSSEQLATRLLSETAQIFGDRVFVAAMSDKGISINSCRSSMKLPRYQYRSTTRRRLPFRCYALGAGG